MTQGAVEDLWESYVAKVYEGPLEGRQLLEVRRAFYAGCFGLKALLDRLALASDADKAEVLTIMLDNELLDFADEVLAGRK